MRLPCPNGGRSCEVGGVVTMLSATELCGTALPPLGLKLHEASEGKLLWAQV